jgi:hypothetical protein
MRPPVLLICLVLVANLGTRSALLAADEADDKEYLRVIFAADHRFGIMVQNIPEIQNKQLTFAPDGKTNNTVVRINGFDVLLHAAHFSTLKVTIPNKRPEPVKNERGKTWTSKWEVPSLKVNVIQEVMLCRGEQTGKFDTVVVSYTLENQSKQRQKLGLRFMLDTLIGQNDGVPFTVPELPNLVTTAVLLSKNKNKSQIPEYVQALEKGDLRDPGTIAHLGVKVSAHHALLESPDLLQIAHWPGPDVGWEVPHEAFGDDSMVALYWNEQLVAPGASRKVGFTYGLAKVANSDSKGKIAVSTGGNFKAGGTFILTAYADPSLNKSTLGVTLPEGLTLAQGQANKQVVSVKAKEPYGKLSWRIKSDRPGTFGVKVATPDGTAETAPVVIRR